MKVFYSWQMDAPRKINKDFIHNALSDAIAMIDEELDVSEAERDVIELDQDTQGVLGSPEISRVIFEKIAASRVVVTDVSLVAHGHERKPHINSNVAIELGYAYGKIGDGSVLKVMNTHYGQPTELPFDLRIRRRPVLYKLEPNADTQNIASERKKLAGQLASILREYVASVEPERQVAHTETPCVGLRGQYWGSNDPLVLKDNDRHVTDDIYYFGQSVLYFRCIPLVALPELSAREAIDFTNDLAPLLSKSGWSHARNKWGVISYDLMPSGDQLVGATQLFRNREIWGIDAEYAEAETKPEDDEEDRKRFIPTGGVQREYPRAINRIRQLAGKLGYGDRYTIEMGFSGAEGVYLGISKAFYDAFPGPFLDQEVYIRKTIAADYPTMQIMNDFWEKLFSEVGRQTPDYLIWTPDEA